VTSGTIGGVAFTVISGRVEQPVADGGIAVDAGGAVILLGATPSGLGMSNANHLHLISRFALSHGGSLTAAAFGTAANPIGAGASLTLGRDALEFLYEVRLGGAQLARDFFNTRPLTAGAEHRIVAEFYADDVPAYGTGKSGVTFWPIDDAAPAFGTDVLGCTPGPALGAAALTGDRIAYELRSAFLTAIEVTDVVIGPCI